jgi:NTE family protein
MVAAMADLEQSRVALVIGAGGVKSAAALGVMRALQNVQITPDLIVGCSTGALYGAAMAREWGLENGLERAAADTRHIWRRDLTGKHNSRALLQALMPRRSGFDGRFGLRDDRLLLSRLEEVFGEQTFASTQIPLLITATDFLTGEQMVLREGRLRDAIRASVAIPFVFAPWAVNDRLLADGYLSDPLPGNVATREGADIIIALGFEATQQQTVDSPLRYALQVSSIMTNSMFTARIAFHTLAHHAGVLLLTPQFGQRIDLFDAEKLPAIIAAGEEAMKAHLPDLRALLDRQTAGSASSQ